MCRLFYRLRCRHTTAYGIGVHVYCRNFYCMLLHAHGKVYALREFSTCAGMYVTTDFIPVRIRV